MSSLEVNDPTIIIVCLSLLSIQFHVQCISEPWTISTLISGCQVSVN